MKPVFIERIPRILRTRKARRELLEKISRLRKEGRNAELAQSLRNLGELERKSSASDDARRRYEESVAIFREVGDPLRLAHTVRHLGDVYSETGDTALAEPCYDEALALYRSHEKTPPLELANAIRSLAVLKGDGGEIEEAMRLWKEAHDLYAGCNLSAGVAESAGRLALLARRNGEFRQSREWFGKASVAAEVSGDEDTLRYMREISGLVND